jgi:putative ABC transport system permease protein
MSGLAQDLRYAVRQMRKNPGFTAVAMLTLALGIGANTAIFSVLNGVLLKMLPVREPAELVQLEETYRGQAFNFFSYPTYLRLRDTNQVFSNLFAWAIRGMNAKFGGDVEPVEGMYVTGNYYAGLGVPALVGRTILPEDDRAGAAPVVVLSYNAWQKRFGANPKVIGQTIMLERVPVTVVGVTPAWFFGTEVGRSFEVAIPVSLQPRLNPDRPFLDRVDAQWIRLMARLSPGVSEQQARADCAILWPQILAEVDPKGVYGAHNFWLRLDPASTGLSQLREEFSRPLFVLVAIAGFVLMIACANVANLLLARASARQREVAVRFALGASRRRLARQMLTESIVLAALGSAAGVIFAIWGARALVGLLSVGDLPKVTLDVGLDGRVLAFTAGVGLLTTLLFGLLPAVRATRTGIETILRGSGRTLGWRRRGVSKVLIAAQMALSLPLLLGAGLFVQSLHKLLTVDAGFNREGVLMVHMNPARAGYKDAALAALYQQLLERIDAVPGVRAASLSTYPPLTGGGGTFFSASGVSVDGHPVPVNTSGNVYLNVIGPRFFETLESPLLAGRDFADRDNQGAPRVAIVSEALARDFFPDRSALGHQIQVEQGPPAEIVGVVKTMKYETLREAPHYIVFEPYGQNLEDARAVYLEVRGGMHLNALPPVIRRQIAEVARDVPIETLSLADWVNHFLIQDRLIAVLASAFGLLAMLLAAVGLYGVMAYGVAQRTGEIGVRVALGADRTNVFRIILCEAAMLVVAGVAVGVPIALALGHWVASMLFDQTPSDPAITFGAAAILAGAALVAAYLPARRASGVDPIVALRHE